MPEDRRLAAIMFTDIVGYTALMGSDENKAFKVLRKNREIQRPLIKKYRGEWLKEMGDGILAQFNSATNAVECAIEIQQQARKELEGQIRIGIHLGDVTFEDEDVFGDGVNISSRLQSITDPGGIYISESTQKAIRGKSDIQTKFLGEFSLKNVDYPVRTYCVLGDNLPVPSSAKIKKLIRRNLTERVFGSIYTYIIVIVLVFIGWWIRNEFYVDKSLSLLFLPIVNYTNTDTLDYLFAGMHNDLIGEAGKISALRVISKTTSNAYKDTEKSIPEIAVELGVNTIIETSVSCYGEQVCFQMAVVDARNDKQLLIKDYTVERSQMPNLFRTLAKEISKEINVTLNPREEELLAESVTVDPEAYDLYMKGQFYFNKYTDESVDSAMQCFELAKEIDPGYVLAYTGICSVWDYRTVWGLVSLAEGNLKSMEALMKAYALDSNNAVVQSSLAGNRMGMYDWEGAEAGFKKSISLNPNESWMRIGYSQLLSILGRHEEALEQIDLALKLDPKNPLIQVGKGVAFIWARKYDEAIKAFNDALDLEPEYEFALWQLWLTYYHVGRTEEAYAQLKSCLSKDEIRYDRELVKYLEQGYLKDGFRGACISLPDRLDELWADHQYIYNPNQIAIFYSCGQEIDKSIYWLEQAYQSRHPLLPKLLIGPSFDHIRTDPRFKDLCQRMNLPHAAVVE